MKKIENFLKESVLIKEKTHMIIGGALTGGYSRPCSKDWSACGSITFNSDSEGSGQGEGGIGGHESWGAAAPTNGCGGSPGC